MAKGAHSVRAQEMPTMPIKAVAAPMLRTMSVLNMQVAKIRWEPSHARRRVRPGMTRASRSREKRVV